MKIALVITQLRNGGGTYQLLYLARQLLYLGHEVTIYSYFKPYQVEPSLLVAQKHLCLGYEVPTQKREWQPLGLIRHLWSLFLMTFRMSRLLWNSNADVFNPHEWPAIWPVLLVKRWKRSKVVWMCNDVWHIPGHEEFPERRILFKWSNHYGLGLIDRKLGNLIDKITVLDHRILKIVKKYYQVPTAVIRSGLDVEKFVHSPSKDRARKEMKIAKNQKVVLALSIFHPHRRFEDVIEAFAQTQDSRAVLYLVGSDAYDRAYSAKIKKLIGSLKLEDRVVIDNRYLTGEQIRNYFAAADIFVFANEKQTWGLAVVEAMAMGIPCIVSNQAGVHEIIQPGKTGFVFQRRNIIELSSYLRKLLASKSLRDSMGEKAKRHALKTYSWNKYAKEMEGVFQEVLEKNNDTAN